MKVSFVLIFLFSSLLFFKTDLKAQTFTFQTDSLSKQRPVKSEIVFDFPIRNLTSQTFKIYIIRRAETIPSEWQGSMCFGLNCFPPFIDSVISEDVLPNDTVDFSYHFFSDSIPGTATVTLVAKCTRSTDSVTATLTGTTLIVGVNDKPSAVYEYSLEQNYPNPFNPSTIINFSVPQRDYVTLKIYDLLGREVNTLVSETLERGSHSVSFKSSGLPSGTYFYKLTTGNYTSIKKMIILK